MNLKTGEGTSISSGAAKEPTDEFIKALKLTYNDKFDRISRGFIFDPTSRKDADSEESCYPEDLSCRNISVILPEPDMSYGNSSDESPVSKIKGSDLVGEQFYSDNESSNSVVEGSLAYLCKTEQPLPVKKFSCFHCEFTTARRYRLKAHVLTKHVEDKPFSCSHCEFTTGSRRSLSVHNLYKHTSVKPYSCPHCEYYAVRSYDLRKHIASKHMGIRPYPCPQCDYHAVRSNDLKRHMFTHMKDRPFSCPHCEHQSVRSNDLKRHIMSKHTKDKPFSCPLCDYQGVRSYDVKKHMKKHKR